MSSVVFIVCVPYTKSWPYSISDLVVANLFKHSLPGMILLYLATPLITPKVLFHKILLIRIRLKFCLVGLIAIAVSFSDGICQLK